jgi:hypothetical protein
MRRSESLTMIDRRRRSSRGIKHGRNCPEGLPFRFSAGLGQHRPAGLGKRTGALPWACAPAPAPFRSDRDGQVGFSGG